VEYFSKDIETITDEGPFSFMPDGNQIYYTRSIEVGKRAKRKRSINNNNGIFIAEKSGAGWTNIHPFEYNDPLWQTAHPAVSSDGKLLFFASNTPGGEGMSDIYMCQWVNGKWAKPENLGPNVNHSGVDLYPWYSPSGELFFSSEREDGLGGLDIYTTRMVNGVWNKPVLLPEPINSISNDFSYISMPGSSDGFFTSDRDKTDDIYRYSSLIIRKAICQEMVIDKYCYEFIEDKANLFNADSLAYEFEWDFDDGNKAKGTKVVHCFEKPGIYVVKLNLIDKISGEIEYNQESTLVDASRTQQAFINSPDTFTGGETVTFDASDTYLPGWSIKEYYWNFDDGSIASGISSQKVFVAPGAYSVQLIITSNPDTEGNVREACVSKIVTVKGEQ
jgi:hypothetical protein